MQKCNQCVRIEKQKKYAWAKFFSFKDKTFSLITEILDENERTGQVDDNIKKLIKRLWNDLPDLSKQCIICHELINQNTKLIITGCGHIYEKDCFIEMKKHSNKCALCREIILKEIEI